MIHRSSERPVPLSNVPAECARITGHRPHRSACYRWITCGVSGGIRLETFKLGGRIFTTVEALDRFIQATSDKSQLPSAVSSSDKIDEKFANAELDAEDI